MSSRAITRHSVHRSRGRLKTWHKPLILTILGLLRARHIFRQKLFMGCGTTYDVSRVLRTIWIAPECHQTSHLWFCGAASEWPRNDRKRVSYSRLKSWESLIYHLISPRVIPRHSVHESRGHLKAWVITFNLDRFRAPRVRLYFLPKSFLWDATRFIMHHGCFAPSELPRMPSDHPFMFL